MKSKSITIFFFIFMLLISLIPSTAYADMGPKPSVNLSFKNMKDETYYITLLSKEKSTGPYSYSRDKIQEDSWLLDEYKEDGLKAWKAFRDYEDNDGFFFIEFFKRCNDEDTFSWTYYPPSTFKVLIYYPDSDTFAVSSIYEKYAFDSYYEATLSNDKTSITLSKSYNYSWEVISLLIRIVATILIELLIAFFFGLWKKNLIGFITIVNIITQVILNLLLNAINYSSGSLMFTFSYVPLEFLILIIELILYSIYFKKASDKMEKPISGWIAPAYAIAANTASFFLGMYLAKIIPGIF